MFQNPPKLCFAIGSQKCTRGSVKIKFVENALIQISHLRWEQKKKKKKTLIEKCGLKLFAKVTWQNIAPGPIKEGAMEEPPQLFNGLK